jgi:hypothetical protein
VFYGPGNGKMTEIYRVLQDGARFYEGLWDEVPSAERSRTYGNSVGKGIGGQCTDELLDMPQLPDAATLKVEPTFSAKYEKKIEAARELEREHSDMVFELTQALSEVDRNHYNLEVLLSLAYLETFGIHLPLALSTVENYLVRAYEAEQQQDASRAVATLIEAYKLTEKIIEKKEWMFSNLETVWEKARFEKCATVNGREFVHVFDDVKDHFADRRKGLEYMIAPYERMKVEAWRDELGKRIEAYAKTRGVALEGMKEVRLED